LAYTNKSRRSIHNIPSNYFQNKKLLKHIFVGAVRLYSSGTSLQI